MKKLVPALLMFLLTAPVHSKELPDIISNGFKFLKQDDVVKAVDTWLKNSTIYGAKAVSAQVTGFDKLKIYCGKYVEHELYKHNNLGSRSDIYLVTLHFDECEVFSEFITYKKPSGDMTIQRFIFQTEPAKVWPSNALYGE